jgi:hypothetical protein
LDEPPENFEDEKATAGYLLNLMWLVIFDSGVETLVGNIIFKENEQK